MAVDWLADVRIYDADADENVVNKIANYCGIALQSRDGQLVAMADAKECETVRENFLKKKLGLSQPDATLDEAIQSVRETMKADRTKNRVTVYYLLSKHFGMLSMFGGAAAGAAGLAAAAAGAFSGDDNDEGGSVAPFTAAAGLAGAGVAAVTGAAASAGSAVSNVASSAADLASDAASSVTGVVSGIAGSVSDAVSAPAPFAAVDSGFDDDNSSGSWGWLKWLLLAALLAALLFFLLRSCSGQEATPVAETETTETAATAETTETPEAAATAETAVAAPVGAGVAAGERNGKPMLTVYFDTGKSDVTADLAAASAKVKAFVAANTGTKLGVSGFNDPTGNAAANAELSKKRAQAVGKALEAAGIPAASIEMMKPTESTDTNVDNNAARRVEVVVQ